jgi:hypothetical protein
MSTQETKLIILKNKSILEKPGEEAEVFEEGANSSEAEGRTRIVRTALADGYLRDIIVQELKSPSVDFKIDIEQATFLKSLVESVTSEVGRALIGITIMQLSIKSICPEQSIRLHKGGRTSGRNFSWKEGISMRTLDKNYITPVLREFDLLRLNADGFMMTRSLAENYPYSELYKAAIRGGKAEWLDIVEALEGGELDPLGALKYLISLLINRSNKFVELSETCLKKLHTFLGTSPSPEAIKNLIQEYVESSEYSARAFEIAIYSAYIALDEMGVVEGHLKPLSQMRSANKKHGNIGDIEILESSQGMTIIESWDAKYGKANLREELEELSEKLDSHLECKSAGFITNLDPIKSEEILQRVADIEMLHDCTIKIQNFTEWHTELLSHLPEEADQFSIKWLTAMAESFCQKRRDRAPIDEPCEHWIQNLISHINL